MALQQQQEPVAGTYFVGTYRVWSSRPSDRYVPWRERKMHAWAATERDARFKMEIRLQRRGGALGGILSVDVDVPK
jgi:hypothetical protein